MVSPVFKVGGSTLLRLNYSQKDFVGRVRTKSLVLLVSLFMRLRKNPFGAAVSPPSPSGGAPTAFCPQTCSEEGKPPKYPWSRNSFFQSLPSNACFLIEKTHQCPRCLVLSALLWCFYWDLGLEISLCLICTTLTSFCDCRRKQNPGCGRMSILPSTRT